MLIIDGIAFSHKIICFNIKNLSQKINVNH